MQISFRYPPTKRRKLNMVKHKKKTQKNKKYVVQNRQSNLPLKNV